MTKDQLITIAHRYGKGLFKFNVVETAVEDYTNALLQQCSVIRWQEFEKQKPPYGVPVLMYEPGADPMVEYYTDDPNWCTDGCYWALIPLPAVV